MTHPAPCLTQLADDLENHGNMLAFISDVHSAELSPRGRIGLIQLSANMMAEFSDIEVRFKRYRTLLTPSC